MILSFLKKIIVILSGETLLTHSTIIISVLLSYCKGKKAEKYDKKTDFLYFLQESMGKCRSLIDLKWIPWYNNTVKIPIRRII